MVDDSIVRGTTTKAMVAMLRESGAKEVHLRISSPPYRWPCFYGLDTGARTELIAADLEVGEICDYLGADSLAYLALDALKKATGVPGAGFCDACLTGNYPVPVPARFSKSVLERPSQARRDAREKGAFAAQLPAHTGSGPAVAHAAPSIFGPSDEGVGTTSASSASAGSPSARTPSASPSFGQPHFGQLHVRRLSGPGPGHLK